MAETLASFAKKLDKMSDLLASPRALTALATRLGVAAKNDAEKAARADLGSDGAFSGWKKKDGGVMPLEAAFKLLKPPGVVLMHRAKNSAGPWRVAEEGRNQNGVGGLFSGPALNHRTGVTSRTKKGNLRMRRTRARRWNGTTQGKSTWSDAERVMEREMPGRVNDEVVKHLRETFGGW